MQGQDRANYIKQYFYQINSPLGNCYLLANGNTNILFDVGMPFAAKTSLEKIENIIGDAPVSHIFLTHTHYDHVAALPAFRKAYPEAEILGTEKAASVFKRPGAIRAIGEMSRIAMKTYGFSESSMADYDDSLFEVTRILRDGDTEYVGGVEIRAVYTPGHTNCSMSYFLPDYDALILSESAGAYLGDGIVTAAILTGYADSLASIEKCRKIGAKNLFVPHHDLLEDISNEEYFNRAAAAAEILKDRILSLLIEGMDDKEIIDTVRNEAGPIADNCGDIQPLEAFNANAKAFLNVVRREFL